jgi:CBS domain-containing protein
MRVDELAQRVTPLSPDDSIARAAEAVRVAPGAAVPIAQNGRIIGVVSARDLNRVFVDPAAAARGAPVRAAMNGACCCLPGGLDVEEALAIFREQEIDAAPVLGPGGRYLGMVGTGTLMSAACGSLRPPMIGGLATPLGVYLTNGAVRGGVGDLALVSAGFFMGLLQFLAAWGAYALTPALAQLLHGVARHVAAAAVLLPSPAAAYFWLPPVLTILFFALLFRLSWVTGYHAAEHQVVHAIEQGDELTLDAVRLKPRVHPRCGTNLMAAFILFMVLHGGLPPELSWLAFPVALIAWRIFGSFLQQYITTRVPNEKQLHSGLRAGEELLARYQNRVTEHPGRLRRLWNIGLLQVLFGFLLLWAFFWLLETVSFLNIPWLEYLGR